MTSKSLSDFSHYWLIGAVVVVAAVSAIAYVVVYTTWSPQKSAQGRGEGTASSAYHTVTATRFWVGEAADASNAYIPNHESAWVGDWIGEFGGIDDPNNRCGYKPCGFTPKQNAFYVALPFNDIDSKGKPKSPEVLKKIPWYTSTQPSGVSLMKNHWVEVKLKDKVAYGQIEDVGPMYEDDIDYVFGSASPKYSKAGIDLSPALSDYLGTDGMAAVKWRFVDESGVLAGPWRDSVTRSQINY